MSATRAPRWYTLAWLLGLPAAALYLCWRSLRQREYLRHWAERFLGHGASVAARPGAPLVWVHAVSVGETRAAQPLVEQLARAHCDAVFVLTHMTPTGRAAGTDLVQAFPGRIQQRYLPYDLPFAVRRFLREVHPGIGILMETEIWPNLLYAARERHVPVVLANARLSQRSLAKALRHGELIRGASACVTIVGAQTQADRARVAQLYDGPIRVTGNLKFDIVPDPAQVEQGKGLRARFRERFGERPLWLFASTREGEERLILDALRTRGLADGASGPASPAPLLLFVPRHPQRFDEVAALLQERGNAVLRRAHWEVPPDARPDVAASPASSSVPSSAVLLGDSMGEMPLYYGMADVALIGGSLLALGGQNLIEACACGCPVVLGPHMFNFSQAADDAEAAGAARRVRDAQQALGVMHEISTSAATRQRMATAALAFSSMHRGATVRTLALIDDVLASAATRR